MGSTARIEPDPAQSDHIGALLQPRVEREHRPERRAIRPLEAAAAVAVGETLSDFFRRAAQTRAREVRRGLSRRFGFRALSTMPRTLMITLGDLREAGY
jgi:hypothetical protein